MDKNKISYKEYDALCNIAMYPYGEVSGSDLIEIHKYLKGKQVTDYIKINDAGKNFLYQVLSRSFYFPFYEKANIDFLSSDYMSDEMKNIIVGATLENYSKELLDILNNNKHFNNYTSEELTKIYDEFTSSKSKYLLYEKMALEDYLFYLDGDGVVEFVKSKYDDRLLALLMLQHSAIDASIYYANNNLVEYEFNENHLLSLYDKYNKYLSEKKDDYFDFVNNINYLTPYNFTENYNTFINNGFNSNFLYTEDNDWLTRFNKDQQRIKNIINDNMHIKFNLGVSERNKTLTLKQS